MEKWRPWRSWSIGALALVALVVAGAVGCTQLQDAASASNFRAGKTLSSFALSDPSVGPDEYEDDGVRGRYVEGGGYEVLVKRTIAYTFYGYDVLPGDPGEAQSLRIEVDVVFGPTDSDQSDVFLMCFSFEGDVPRAAYGFYLTPRGTSFINKTLRNENPGTVLLSSVEPSRAVRPSLPNRIQAECLQDDDSSLLILTVNGTELLRATDASQPPGSVFGNASFGVISAPQPGFFATFSRLRVTEMLPSR